MNKGKTRFSRYLWPFWGISRLRMPQTDMGKPQLTKIKNVRSIPKACNSGALARNLTSWGVAPEVPGTTQSAPLAPRDYEARPDGFSPPSPSFYHIVRLRQARKCESL